MICCGITGHTGNLGKKFIKIANNFKYIKFKGDIRKKKDVEKWIKNNNFDLIVHFAAVVPISMVNKNYKLAMNVNFNGTKNLIKIPDEIDFSVAASLMTKGLTTYYLLCKTYAVSSNETILFHAAAGGVGQVFCQWAKSLGCKVIGTVG